MRLYHPRFRLHQAARLLTGQSVPVAMVDGVALDAAWIAANFPNLPYVGGYDDGLYDWSTAEWAAFGHATNRIHIVVNATDNDGDVLDWEPGNESEGSPYGWIALRKSAGYFRPTIYCNLETLPSVRVNTAEYLLGQDYDVWVADWTGAPHTVTVTTTGTGPDVKSGVYTCPVVQYYGGADDDRDDRSAVYDTSWPYRAATEPAWPVPAIGSDTVYPASVNFGWTNVGAGAYHFQIDGLTDVHVPTPYVHGVQLYSGNYKCRVAADAGSGHEASAWSAWYAFTV